MGGSSSPDAAVVRERLVFGFNTFYGELLAGVARSDDLLKRRLKKGYRVLDRKSDAYLLDFHASARELGTLGRVFDEGCGDDPSVQELQVARGLRYREIPPGEFSSVRLLCAFAWLLGELIAATEEEDEEARESAVAAVNELFERLIENVSRVQGGMSWGGALDGLVDEEARAIFSATLSSLAGSRPGGGDRLTDSDVESMASAFDMMKCSKLGGIVQEISNSIDKDSLRQAVEAGADQPNMDMMGDLFKKVSGAITSKLASGEISNEDLIRETTSLMSSMKGIM